ncbi:putative lipoprotein [Labilithrix luteola]|uniref:Putative lipoprotein n=1 Tax=Labilithrix luteola TaxID=1391654 RepID=A0A0K1PU41_9BACT|nr:hypothetical protein [Labilithrix luteola]AKU96881.1 putative lipoprotein [Labilithrix luteola]
MRSKMRRCWSGATLGLALLAPACVWETDLPSSVREIPVDANRELVVTDDALLGALSSNAEAAPLSFRRAMDALALDDEASAEWLESWSARLDADGHSDRANALRTLVTCRWLKSAPDNGCDDLCTACAARALPLEQAPFRLVAVVNRTDLSVMPDRAAEGGEGRLVYALTDGPADEPTSQPLPVSVIFEYAQEGTALEWSRRWHSLGSVSSSDLPRALVDLTDRFVASGSLAQVRTADAWNGPMVIHQFAREAGALRATRVRNTPIWSRVTPSDLRAFVDEHEAAVADGTMLMPRGWWAPSSSPNDEVPAFLAEIPSHELLVRQTCGGCHARSETGFHVDPRGHGTSKLSTFLADPSKETDELRRRTTWMQLTLSSE